MADPKPLDQVYQDLVSFVDEEKTRFTIQDNRLIFIGDNDLSYIIRHFRDAILEWDIDPSVLNHDEMQALALSRNDSSTWGLDIPVDDLVHLLAFLSLSNRTNERDLHSTYLPVREQGGTHCKDHQCHVAYVEREIDVISRRLDDTESKYDAKNLLEKRVNSAEHAIIRTELALDNLSSQNKENRDTILKQIVQANEKYMDLHGKLLHDTSLQKAMIHNSTKHLSRLEHRIEALESKSVSSSSDVLSNIATHPPRLSRSYTTQENADQNLSELDILHQYPNETTPVTSPTKSDFSSSPLHGTEKLDDFALHQISFASELNVINNQSTRNQSLIGTSRGDQAPLLFPIAMSPPFRLSPGLSSMAMIIDATPRTSWETKSPFSVASPRFRRYSTGTFQAGVSGPPSRTCSRSPIGLAYDGADYARPHGDNLKRPRRNSTGTSSLNTELSHSSLTLHPHDDFPVKKQLVTMPRPVTSAADDPITESLLNTLQISVSCLSLWWVICGFWMLGSWVVKKATGHSGLAASSIGEGYAIKMDIYTI